ncbi:MAG: hypothetical protein AVDCRST_MAG22-748, partial [uncultured Rubrobacteraceae bacterium]
APEPHAGRDPRPPFGGPDRRGRRPLGEAAPHQPRHRAGAAGLRVQDLPGQPQPRRPGARRRTVLPGAGDPGARGRRGRVPQGRDGHAGRRRRRGGGGEGALDAVRRRERGGRRLRARTRPYGRHGPLHKGGLLLPHQKI